MMNNQYEQMVSSEKTINKINKDFMTGNPNKTSRLMRYAMFIGIIVFVLYFVFFMISNTITAIKIKKSNKALYVRMIESQEKTIGLIGEYEEMIGMKGKMINDNTMRKTEIERLERVQATEVKGIEEYKVKIETIMKELDDYDTTIDLLVNANIKKTNEIKKSEENINKYTAIIEELTKGIK